MGGKENPAPEEYLTYLVMCKLHKFESEVNAEPARHINRLLTIMNVEGHVNEERQRQQIGSR